MKIVFMGTPDFAAVILQALLDSEHEICGVATQPDKAKDRGKKIQLTPVKELAISHGIPVLQPERVYFMINPVILEQSGSQSGDEGCLSVPGLIGSVERPSHIKIEALDLDGNKQVYEFDDFDARVMCHEYDHLDGVLYIDKAEHIRPAESEAVDEEAE